MNVGRRAPWGTPNTGSDSQPPPRVKKKPSGANRVDNGPRPANGSPLKLSGMRSFLNEIYPANIC